MRLYAAERRKDPAFAAIQRERVKKWREANREKSRASSQAWREAILQAALEHLESIIVYPPGMEPKENREVEERSSRR